MKHARALKPHVYNGKRRHVGDVYPIRRTDYQLFVKIGNIEIVQAVDQKEVESYLTAAMEEKPAIRDHLDYRTTAMEAEPAKPKKRSYIRKKVYTE